MSLLESTTSQNRCEAHGLLMKKRPGAMTKIVTRGPEPTAPMSGAEKVDLPELGGGRRPRRAEDAAKRLVLGVRQETLSQTRHK